MDGVVLRIAHALACWPTRLAYELPLDAAARRDPPELVARIHDLPFDADPPARLTAFDRFLLAYQLGLTVTISATSPFANCAPLVRFWVRAWGLGMMAGGVLMLPEIDCPTQYGVVRSQQPWYLAANKPGFHARLGPLERVDPLPESDEEPVEPEVPGCGPPPSLSVVRNGTHGKAAPLDRSATHAKPRRRDRAQLARQSQGPLGHVEREPARGVDGITERATDEQLAAASAAAFGDGNAQPEHAPEPLAPEDDRSREIANQSNLLALPQDVKTSLPGGLSFATEPDKWKTDPRIRWAFLDKPTWPQMEDMNGQFHERRLTTVRGGIDARLAMRLGICGFNASERARNEKNVQ